MSYIVRDSGASVSTPNAADTTISDAVTALVNVESVDAIVGGLRSSKSIAIATALGGSVAQVSPASTSRTLSDSGTYPSFFRVIFGTGTFNDIRQNTDIV